MSMTADLLRDAAAVLRRQAQAATPGPWRQVEFESRRYGLEYVVTTVKRPVEGRSFPRVLDAEGWSDGKDTTYAATMHPGVGIKLAFWLDYAAECEPEELDDAHPAVQIACAILDHRRRP
jgi:hypothetical protein